MAASSVMQSILVSPVFGGAKSSNRISRNCFAPQQRRSSSVMVRCMSEDGKKEQAGPSPITPSATGPSSPAAAGPSSPTPTPPPQKPKVSTDFFDLLAFSGPAPERINGRLAMIGFVAALAVEFFRGEDVFAQIANGGASWFLLTTVVLSVASLIPLSSGVTVESKSQQIMSSDAEMWNGRFAMLGLVALAFTEFVKGGALIA